MEDRTLLTTFLVTNTGDVDSNGVPVPGSLRQAILDSNNTPGPNTIAFDIGGGGPQTITVANGLPQINVPTTIDGTTQPGYAGQPIIEIHGYNPNNSLLNYPGQGAGLLLVNSAGGSLVKGLVINNFTGEGIAVGVDGVLIEGNYIGTDMTGTVAEGNSRGIYLAGHDTTIGGTTADTRNVISGNAYSGIDFQSDVNGGTTLIKGNFIGVDATGSAALGNGIEGIADQYAAANVIIGGTAPGAGNVISANAADGLGLDPLNGTVTIQGNYIGTNAAGDAALGNGRDGVELDGLSSFIVGGSVPGAGNVISGNQGRGIADYAGGDTIQGNFVGTSADGAVALGNGGYGIQIYYNDHTIGGTTAAARNVISGNGDAGLEIESIGNLVQGNYIGTNATGTAALGNHGDGVRLLSSYPGNTIGGTAAGAGNVISGNTGNGLEIVSVGGALVRGNSIGTNATGTAAVPNAADGIYLNGGTANTIGGTTLEARNIISGDGTSGIEVFDSGGNVIQGNVVGTDAAGGALGNTADGILLSDPYANTFSNAIGGTLPGSGNTIAYNGHTGVAVTQGASLNVGNAILSNAIFSNGALGIDLGDDGVTPNDLGDLDNGPNNLQNFPVLSSATADASGATVEGSLSSGPNTTYTLQFFANATPDPSGYGEGQTYLGQATVMTDGSGNARFSVTLPAPPAGQPYLSATATDPTGNTSEFSRDAEVQTAQMATVTALTASVASPLLGESVTFTAVVTAASGIPTGSVDFVDATTNTDLGPVPLSSHGVAALTTSALAVGGHTIVATYGGDATYLPSYASTTINVLPPASLSGLVFDDVNNNGQVDFGEPGLPGVPIALTGTNDLGNAVNLSQTTDADGTYAFLNLRPGSYTITETQQPAGYTQGIDTVGTAGGTLSGTQFTVSLPSGVNGLNYNYGERPNSTGSAQSGQTATIGFWNNKNGQALINALNGGIGTHLGDWLAATFPHMFGSASGSNDLAGESNADIAAFFQEQFVVHGQKLDAQVLATALADYVTDPALDTTGVGAQYGFIVGGNGLATATDNIGSNGAAFGVADNTVMTVIDILLAADAQAVNGVLYNGDSARRNMANNVFSGINQAGDI